MRMQTIGFSTSVLVHGAFGLLLFSLVRLVPEGPPPLVIDLSILAGQPPTPVLQAVPAQEPAPTAIVPAEQPVMPEIPQPVVQEMPQPVVPQEVVQPRSRKKIVKKLAVPMPKAVQLSAPAMETAAEQEGPAPAGAATEAMAPAAQPPLARSEGGVPHTGQGTPTATEASGGGKTLTLEERYRQEHFNFIKEAIRKNMTYPALARKNGWQGRVLVSFVICLDGKVEDLRIEKSSGIALLDNNAIDIIRQSAPFPHPPVRATLIVPINYTLV